MLEVLVLEAVQRPCVGRMLNAPAILLPSQTSKTVRKQVHIGIQGVVFAVSIPAFPDQPPLHQQQPIRYPSEIPNPNSNSSSKDWRAFARGKWHRDKDSSLNNSDPLPLPMTYPGSSPAPEDVEKMQNCDATVKDCSPVIYQWTGKCSRCQGTGEVSFFRKKGREVISKCVTCMGLGYVHKMTTRTDAVSDEQDDL